MARHIAKMTLGNSFQLMKLLDEEYVTSKMTDEVFAAHATQKLGMQINRDHVYNRRKAMAIPANGAPIVVSKDSEALLGLLMGLEVKLAAFEKRLETLEFKTATHGLSMHTRLKD